MTRYFGVDIALGVLTAVALGVAVYLLFWTNDRQAEHLVVAGMACFAIRGLIDNWLRLKIVRKLIAKYTEILEQQESYLNEQQAELNEAMKVLDRAMAILNKENPDEA